MHESSHLLFRDSNLTIHYLAAEVRYGNVSFDYKSRYCWENTRLIEISPKLPYLPACHTMATRSSTRPSSTSKQSILVQPTTSLQSMVYLESYHPRMPDGQIAGLVVGCVAFAGILGLCFWNAFLLARRRSEKRRLRMQETSGRNETTDPDDRGRLSRLGN